MNNNLKKINIYIQQKILFKNFKNTLNKNNNVFTHMKKFSNSNNDIMFDEFTKYINNKNVIYKVNIILNKYYNWLYFDSNQIDFKLIAPRITSKQLLSCYLIYYFPQFIISYSNNLTEDLQYLSYVLIQNIENINNIKIYKFVISMNQYINCFNEFINYDKQYKIKELIDKWIDLEKTIKLVENNDRYEDKDDIIIHLKEEQVRTIKYIKIIDNNFDTNILSQIYNITINVENTMSKCYFDNLEKDIIDCKYIVLQNVLTEIKDNLIMLYKQSKKELDEYFDIEFIIQKLNNKVFPIEDFISLVDYIIDIIVLLQAPIRNKDTLNKWNTLKILSTNDIDSIESDSETYKMEYGIIYANTATKAIKIVLDEIVIIKNDIIVALKN
jgi:hypothetical protein